MNDSGEGTGILTPLRLTGISRYTGFFSMSAVSIASSIILAASYEKEMGETEMGETGKGQAGMRGKREGTSREGTNREGRKKGW